MRASHTVDFGSPSEMAERSSVFAYESGSNRWHFLPIAMGTVVVSDSKTRAYRVSIALPGSPISRGAVRSSMGSVEDRASSCEVIHRVAVPASAPAPRRMSGLRAGCARNGREEALRRARPPGLRADLRATTASPPRLPPLPRPPLRSRGGADVDGGARSPATFLRRKDCRSPFVSRAVVMCSSAATSERAWPLWPARPGPADPVHKSSARGQVQIPPRGGSPRCRRPRRPGRWPPARAILACF